MAERLSIVPATVGHAVRMAPRMRAADAREVWAAGRLTPMAALSYSLEETPEPWAAIVRGRCMAIWGVAPASTLSGVGTPWLLAAEGFPRGVRGEFLRLSRRFVDEWLADYSCLTNMVDVRNHASITWLTWLGAAWEAPEPCGPDGVLFRRFTIRR